MFYYFVGSILSYAAIVVFTVGILYRLGRWVGARIVHNIVLSPFSRTPADMGVNIAAEAFLFRSIYRFNKKFWLGAWMMHVALLSVLGGHLVGIYTLGQEFTPLGLSSGQSMQASDLLGTTFGIILLVALLYLLYRRVVIKEVRVISATSDFLHVLLIFGIAAIGTIMRLFPAYGIDYSPVRAWVTGLLAFTPVPFPHVPLFAVHIMLVEILMIVFPYSKLMHLLGMFANRWIMHKVYIDPAPGLPGVSVPDGAAALNVQSASGEVF